MVEELHLSSAPEVAGGLSPDSVALFGLPSGQLAWAL